VGKFQAGFEFHFADSSVGFAGSVLPALRRFVGNSLIAL
jgi:hypothetical protein